MSECDNSAQAIDNHIEQNRQCIQRARTLLHALRVRAANVQEPELLPVLTPAHFQSTDDESSPKSSVTLVDVA
jgi:hypothetical protein